MLSSSLYFSEASDPLNPSYLFSIFTKDNISDNSNNSKITMNSN